VVEFSSDEVLSGEWFREYMGLGGGVEVNIFEIKRRLERLGQVREARVERRAVDGRVVVRVWERKPVLRLRGVLPDGRVGVRVVASDGVVYEGVGYGQWVYEGLPWLRLPEGFLARGAGGWDVVREFERVAPLVLLAKADRQFQEIYAGWESVSMGDFAHGGGDMEGVCIRVRLREGGRMGWGGRIRDVVFSARDFEREYLFLRDAGFRGAVEAGLRRGDAGRFALYDLYLCFENKHDPRAPRKEPWLLGVDSPLPR
jgi:hypothetical protein